MALNMVRGFRWIGWVLTFPLAALIVLVLYENTKEFTPSNYVAIPDVDYDAIANAIRGTASPRLGYVLEMPGLGYVYFSGEVPADVVIKIPTDFGAKHNKTIAVNPRPWELDWSKLPTPPPGYALQDHGRFTVHKQVNKLKLAGLLASSILISALISFKVPSQFSLGSSEASREMCRRSRRGESPDYRSGLEGETGRSGSIR